MKQPFYPTSTYNKLLQYNTTSPTAELRVCYRSFNIMVAQTSLEKLRELSGTTKQGTTLLGSVSSSQSVGVFGTWKRSGSTSRIIDHKEPLILHVVMEVRLQHYVVCYGFDR